MILKTAGTTKTGWAFDFENNKAAPTWCAHDFVKQILQHMTLNGPVSILPTVSANGKKVSLDFIHHAMGYEESPFCPWDKGIYTIYYKHFPVYVGQSEKQDFWNRVYRFIKELHGLSSPKESHPGAMEFKRKFKTWDNNEFKLEYCTTPTFDNPSIDNISQKQLEGAIIIELKKYYPQLCNEIANI